MTDKIDDILDKLYDRALIDTARGNPTPVQSRKWIAHAKAALLEALLDGAPEDMALHKDESDTDYFYGYGYNQANAAWREHIKKVLGGK